METESEQNSSSTNGSSSGAGGSARPQIAQMSLYERQAVQVSLGWWGLGPSDGLDVFSAKLRGLMRSVMGLPSTLRIPGVSGS